MSGGRFSYIDSRLKNEIFDYSVTPTNVFEDREISQLVWDVLDLIHDYDWYASGDACEETYLEKKMKFKQKWLPKDDTRVKQIVDAAINEVREELYKTYDLEVKDA